MNLFLVQAVILAYFYDDLNFLRIKEREPKQSDGIDENSIIG